MSIQRARERIKALVRADLPAGTVSAAHDLGLRSALRIIREEEADSLDTALVAVEAALPEGWHFDGLNRIEDEDRWEATAEAPLTPGLSRRVHVPDHVDVAGATPVATLRALTAKLRAHSAASQGVDRRML
jgi:hypothetical protein